MAEPLDLDALSRWAEFASTAESEAHQRYWREQYARDIPILIGEVHRLRNRITEIVAILTDEQRTRLLEDSAARLDERDRTAARPELRVMEDNPA